MAVAATTRAWHPPAAVCPLLTLCPGQTAESEKLAAEAAAQKATIEELQSTISILSEERDLARNKEEEYFLELEAAQAELERIQTGYVELSDRLNDKLDEVFDLQSEVESAKAATLHWQQAALAGKGASHPCVCACVCVCVSVAYTRMYLVVLDGQDRRTRLQQLGRASTPSRRNAKRTCSEPPSFASTRKLCPASTPRCLSHPHQPRRRMQPRLAFLNQTPHQQLPLLRQLLVVAVLTTAPTMTTMTTTAMTTTSTRTILSHWRPQQRCPPPRRHLHPRKSRPCRCLGGVRVVVRPRHSTLQTQR